MFFGTISNQTSIIIPSLVSAIDPKVCQHMGFICIYLHANSHGCPILLEGLWAKYSQGQLFGNQVIQGWDFSEEKALLDYLRNLSNPNYSNFSNLNFIKFVEFSRIRHNMYI